MAIVETEDRYTGAFDVLVCPVCGAENWTHLVYQGVFCTECNTRCRLREPVGDQGFIAEFDSEHMWATENAEPIPETDEYGACAAGKWHGTATTSYERYWFAAYADHVDSYTGDWQPAWNRTTSETATDD
jgi:hypothetical protein